MKRAPRLRRRSLLAVAAVAVALAVVVGLARGYRLALVRTAPWGASDSAVLRFDGVPDVERLENDGFAGAAVRNVILLVGDGMGFQQMAAARIRLHGADGRLFLERLPIAAWVWVHSASSLYTDSAAAATALASGVKTRPRELGLDSSGHRMPTILEVGLRHGMRAGLVTSTVIVDATPAAFVSHVRSRQEVEAIAGQMASSGVEFLVGEAPAGGSFRGHSLEALERPFVEAGYAVVESWEALAAAGGSSRKVAAFLPPGSITERDRRPSLAELADLALERLGGREAGFFLLLEDEEPDTQSHAGDLTRMVEGVRALDEATRRSVAFARRDGHTLVLVTADHETGGLGLERGDEGEPMPYRWYSSGHTAGPVPLLAFGAGAERFSGVLDNTEISHRLAELLSFEFPTSQ